MGGMFFFSLVFLFVGFIKHRGRCSPKGEGSVIALLKIPCNIVNKGKIITKVMRHLFQVESSEKNILGLLWLRETCKGIGKGFGKA